MTTRPAATLSFEIVSDLAALHRLRPEWDALWQRAAAPASLSFSYAALAFATIRRFPGQRPHCLVGRIGGRLVLLWPLMHHRSFGLWRSLRPLGPDAAEEADMLAEPGEAAQAHADAAWAALPRAAAADRLILPFVRQGSLLQASLRRCGTVRVLAERPDQSWSLAWPAGQGWQAWYGGLSSRYRRTRKYKRAVLSRSGVTSFEVLEDPDRGAAEIETMLRWKRQWAVRARPDREGHWLRQDAYATFLGRFLADDGTAPQARMAVLRLNGRIVAALVMAVGPSQVDWIISGFDPALASGSPGMALYEHALQWAHARGLGINFGVGSELNKRTWCDGRSQAVASLVIGLNPWGALGHRLGRLLEVARSRRG